mmetsp:Transcript_31774/g.84843  ORF Transcript_31774/g.84843 Transcript_31774/m.84843 type:complete len:365 (-) Transcript_31774:632-1726(-)
MGVTTAESAFVFDIIFPVCRAIWNPVAAATSCGKAARTTHQLFSSNFPGQPVHCPTASRQHRVSTSSDTTKIGPITFVAKVVVVPGHRLLDLFGIEFLMCIVPKSPCRLLSPRLLNATGALLMFWVRTAPPSSLGRRRTPCPRLGRRRRSAELQAVTLHGSRLNSSLKRFCLRQQCGQRWVINPTLAQAAAGEVESYPCRRPPPPQPLFHAVQVKRVTAVEHHGRSRAQRLGPAYVAKFFRLPAALQARRALRLAAHPAASVLAARVHDAATRGHPPPALLGPAAQAGSPARSRGRRGQRCSAEIARSCSSSCSRFFARLTHVIRSNLAARAKIFLASIASVSIFGHMTCHSSAELAPTRRHTK